MLFYLISCSTSSMSKKDSSSVISTLENQSICPFSDEKQDCIGKHVRVTGEQPKVLYSHPIISLPSGVDSVQSYLDLEDQQLIILSEEPWDGKGRVEVFGLLLEIDMGGPEGTRSSYRNYYISKSTIRCL